MGDNHEPYAVIVLNENDFLPQRQYELCVSLSLTFLLSAHIRFFFPMSGQGSRVVDRAFDRVLKGLAMVSKGIAYEKDLPGAQVERLLEGTHFLITSDAFVQKKMNARACPNLLLAFRADRTPLLRLRFLDKLENGGLKWQLAACAQLINGAGQMLDCEENLRDWPILYPPPAFRLNGFREGSRVKQRINLLSQSFGASRRLQKFT